MAAPWAGSKMIPHNFLGMIFKAKGYSVEFSRISEGESDDAFTGRFYVRSRSEPRQSDSVEQRRPSRRGTRSMSPGREQGSSHESSAEETTLSNDQHRGPLPVMLGQERRGLPGRSESKSNPKYDEFKTSLDGLSEEGKRCSDQITTGTQLGRQSDEKAWRLSDEAQNQPRARNGSQVNRISADSRSDVSHTGAEDAQHQMKEPHRRSGSRNDPSAKKGDLVPESLSISELQRKSGTCSGSNRLTPEQPIAQSDKQDGRHSLGSGKHTRDTSHRQVSRMTSASDVEDTDEDVPVIKDSARLSVQSHCRIVKGSDGNAQQDESHSDEQDRRSSIASGKHRRSTIAAQDSEHSRMSSDVESERSWVRRDEQHKRPSAASDGHQHARTSSRYSQRSSMAADVNGDCDGDGVDARTRRLSNRSSSQHDTSANEGKIDDDGKTASELLKGPVRKERGDSKFGSLPLDDKMDNDHLPDEDTEQGKPVARHSGSRSRRGSRDEQAHDSDHKDDSRVRCSSMDPMRIRINDNDDPEVWDPKESRALHGSLPAQLASPKKTWLDSLSSPFRRKSTTTPDKATGKSPSIAARDDGEERTPRRWRTPMSGGQPDAEHEIHESAPNRVIAPLWPDAQTPSRRSGCHRRASSRDSQEHGAVSSHDEDGSKRRCSSREPTPSRQDGIGIADVPDPREPPSSPETSPRKSLVGRNSVATSEKAGSGKQSRVRGQQDLELETSGVPSDSLPRASKSSDALQDDLPAEDTSPRKCSVGSVRSLSRISVAASEKAGSIRSRVHGQEPVVEQNSESETSRVYSNSSTGSFKRPRVSQSDPASQDTSLRKTSFSGVGGPPRNSLPVSERASISRQSGVREQQSEGEQNSKSESSPETSTKRPAALPPGQDTSSRTSAVNNDREPPRYSLPSPEKPRLSRQSGVHEQQQKGEHNSESDTSCVASQSSTRSSQHSSSTRGLLVTIQVQGATRDSMPAAVWEPNVSISAWAPGYKAPRSLATFDWSQGFKKRLRVKPAETELMFEVLKQEESGETRAPEGAIHGKVALGDTDLLSKKPAILNVPLGGDPGVDGSFLRMKILEAPMNLSFAVDVEDKEKASLSGVHPLPKRRGTPYHHQVPSDLPTNDRPNLPQPPPSKRHVQPKFAGSKGLGFKRAECRFTVPATITFCGVATTDVQFSTEELKTEPILGRDRSALLLLLGQAKDLIEHVHQEPRFAGASSAAGAMPGILASLGAELSVCFQSLSEANHVDTIDGMPLVLSMLTRFVEVLDTLVPIEDLDLDPAITRVSGGGEATPTFTEEVMQALRQVLGVNGFLPQCVACLGDTDLWSWLLHADGTRHFAEELRFHLLLALRLTLAWDPPRGVSRPAEVMLDSGGLEVLCDVITDLGGGTKQAEKCDKDAPPRAAQLGLAFESLRLLLRLSLRSWDCSLHSPCRSKKVVSSLVSRGSRVSVADAVSKLAKTAVKAMEELADLPPALEEAVDAAVPATVRFLAFLMEVPPVAKEIDKDTLARAIVRSIHARPLTLRLTVAVKELVSAPEQHRSSWMAWSTGADKTAKKLRDQLLDCLEREKMPSRLAAKAKEHLQEILEKKGNQQAMQDPTTGLREKAMMQYAKMVAVAAFYDNVEAVTECVCGSKQDPDLADLKDVRDSLGAGQEPESPSKQRGSRSKSLSEAMTKIGSMIGKASE